MQFWSIKFLFWGKRFLSSSSSYLFSSSLLPVLIRTSSSSSSSPFSSPTSSSSSFSLPPLTLPPHLSLPSISQPVYNVIHLLHQWSVHVAVINWSVVMLTHTRNHNTHTPHTHTHTLNWFQMLYFFVDYLFVQLVLFLPLIITLITHWTH